MVTCSCCFGPVVEQHSLTEARDKGTTHLKQTEAEEGARIPLSPSMTSLQ
jgi:hypothetical protein